MASLVPAGAMVQPPPPALDEGGGGALKVAVTVAPSLTVHVPVPPHAPPLHPPKVDPFAAAAVSVTLVPKANDAEQVVPQLMPAGVEVTVPEPVPAFFTVSPNGNASDAARASIRPAPKVVSCPGVPRSTALFIKALAISVALVAEARLFKRAATPATCGDAADVPKKVVGNPPAPVTDTPSIAVTSGFARVARAGKIWLMGRGC